MENAQKIQSLLGGNPMIKNVLSNPEHMKNAQKMLQSPDVQKQIGGLISNPKVIQRASEVLSGLQQINSTQAGGRRRRKSAKKRRRKRRGGETRRQKVEKRAKLAKDLMQIHDKGQRQNIVSAYCMTDATAPICKIPRDQLGGRRTRRRRKRRKRGGITQAMYNEGNRPTTDEERKRLQAHHIHEQRADVVEGKRMARGLEFSPEYKAPTAEEIMDRASGITGSEQEKERKKAIANFKPCEEGKVKMFNTTTGQPYCAPKPEDKKESSKGGRKEQGHLLRTAKMRE